MIWGMHRTAALVKNLQEAAQDFEWYPTTEPMIAAIVRAIGTDRSRLESVLDIGAGDGRVLLTLQKTYEHATLFGIEKSPILQQAQPESVIPVGVDFWEQDLMSLPVTVAFSNPPYSEFVQWAERIINTVHAEKLFLVMPKRWDLSVEIETAIKGREATTRVIYSGDFYDADRSARAVIDIVEVSFGSGYYREKSDPFDQWFDKNIDTFDRHEVSDIKQDEQRLARLHDCDNIPALVDAYNEEYAVMEANYKAIFKLDQSILKELGVNKNQVREGLKKRMAGLKNVYWQALFDHLEVVTSRLTTKTRKRFLDRITGTTSVAFTIPNAYSVVLWAIKFANQYFDEQLVSVFRALSTHDGVLNYKSNERTWKNDGWRYNAEEFDHYTLDYRVVLHHHAAINKNPFDSYNSPGGLHQSSHEMIDDLIAVFGNLGFLVQHQNSRRLQWVSNGAQFFVGVDGATVFEVKAFINGNLHFKFRPAAIKALNIEAGRLLGWLRSPAEAAAEMGCTEEETGRFFGSNQRLGTTSVKLLSA